MRKSLQIPLDGLEAAIEAAVPKSGSRVNVIRYADDIVITGASRELLEQRVRPALEAFLAHIWGHIWGVRSTFWHMF